MFCWHHQFFHFFLRQLFGNRLRCHFSILKIFSSLNDFSQLRNSYKFKNFCQKIITFSFKKWWLLTVFWRNLGKISEITEKWKFSEWNWKQRGEKIKILQIWHWELHANDIFDLILVKRLDFCRAWAQLDIMRRGIITTGSYLTC